MSFLLMNSKQLFFFEAALIQIGEPFLFPFLSLLSHSNQLYIIKSKWKILMRAGKTKQEGLSSPHVERAACNMFICKAWNYICYWNYICSSAIH